MSDVRSLLKAKRQELRINHPLALYAPNGQLRCSICETNIKHPSAWDGHLGSKGHRTNAAHIREEERSRKELELEEAKHIKRKMVEDDINKNLPSTSKKSRIGSAPHSSTPNFPSDFFSDPLQAPFPSSVDSDDEEIDAMAVITKPLDEGGDSSIDQEWIQFQQSVVNAPDEAVTYDRATIVVEPELVSEPSQGFPIPDDKGGSPMAKVDENLERRRKDQEERELIMDRLLDEERAQEEADMKVTIMKNRLEALRKKRELFLSTKSDTEVV